jgi:NitT/TauT family transport system substrate-binding protein
MNCRVFAFLPVIAALLSPAAAQERVTIGTTRAVASGALFIAAARGYFKDEGLDVDMTAYQDAQSVAEALAGGATDLGLAEFTTTAFKLAAQGSIKAIAAQVREQRDFEGNELVASNGAWGSGLRRMEDVAGRTVAITQLGSIFHYQFGQIARIKRFDLKGVALKAMQSLDGVAQAVGTSQVDAAILPPQYARELLVAGQVKLIGWYSEVDEQQLGALFASSKTLATRRATVEKFLRAYRRGAADYTAALARRDRYGKRAADAKAHEAAGTIARYVYPGYALDRVTITVETAAYYMDPQAKLDTTDLARQMEWYKAQGLIDPSTELYMLIDTGFVN